MWFYSVKAYPALGGGGSFEDFQPKKMLWGWTTSEVTLKLFKPHVIDEKLKIKYVGTLLFRFVGRFEFLTESVLIRDVELVKKITVKDFEHFIDHRSFDGESFFNRTLFLMQGENFLLNCCRCRTSNGRTFSVLNSSWTS